MKKGPILKSLVVLAMGVLFVVGNPVPVKAEVSAKDVAGSYLALLDLGGLGAPRIEASLVYLDQNGGVLSTTEHEADKESAGVGVWKHLPGGQIGMGVSSFRFEPDPATSVCGLVGVTSPPDNCVLKFGGILSPQADGSLAGDLFLTIETLDGSMVLAFPGDPALPISMKRLSLEDFPGALP